MVQMKKVAFWTTGISEHLANVYTPEGSTTWELNLEGLAGEMHPQSRGL